MTPSTPNKDLRAYRLNERTIRTSVIGTAGYASALVGIVLSNGSLVFAGILGIGWALLMSWRNRG